ncbi:MAG: type II toxin-antitoxin system ParD family antitoxin [Thermomicrobiales bacterium]
MATIPLSDQDIELIQEYIDLGRFENPSEVVHAALSAFDEQERLAALRAAIAEGDADFERGDYVTWTPTFSKDILREIREEEANSR